MTTLFSKAITGESLTTLVKFIDVDHGLWLELQARQILTDEQLEDCKCQVSHLSVLETAIAFHVIVTSVYLNVLKLTTLQHCIRTT